ncbi:hypothetical protein ACWG0P_07150 [Amedibacillus sp. YH-ame6]
MGIGCSTLQTWKATYKEIQEALKKDKEVVDIEVENSLLKKAKGYNVEVKKTFKVRTKKFSETTGKLIEDKEELVQAIDEVHIPADTTAQIFWLKNRRSQAWRDKQEIVSTEANEIAKKVEALNKSVVESVVKNRDIEDLE